MRNNELQIPRLPREPLPSPELELNPRVLAQAVAHREERLYSLGEYVVAKHPGLNDYISVASEVGVVPRVEELTVSELQEVVCARYSAGMEGRKLFVFPGGEFDTVQILEEIRNLTSLGQRLVNSAIRYIGEIEDLVDKGKFKLSGVDTSNLRTKTD